MLTKIVVLQCTREGYFACKTLLDDMGFREKSDYCFVSERAMDWAFGSDHSQLFITGTLNGSIPKTLSMIHRLKNRNPQLVCMSFSKTPFDAEAGFEVRVDKVHHKAKEEFYDAVRGFTNGMIIRKRPSPAPHSAGQAFAPQAV